MSKESKEERFLSGIISSAEHDCCPFALLRHELRKLIADAERQAYVCGQDNMPFSYADEVSE